MGVTANLIVACLRLVLGRELVRFSSPTTRDLTDIFLRIRLYLRAMGQGWERNRFAVQHPLRCEVTSRVSRILVLVRVIALLLLDIKEITGVRWAEMVRWCCDILL